VNNTGLQAACGIQAIAAFLSDEFDFAAVADVPFGGNWPSLPGYKFIPIAGTQFIIPNIAATTFAVGPTVSVGNDADFNNILAAGAFPSAAALNLLLAAGSGGPYKLNSANATGSFEKLPDLATPPTIRISVAATGTAITQARARLLIPGILTKIFPTI
jgi:hypothetical protein